MLLLTTGLVLFLGVHSSRIIAPELLYSILESRGELAYKVVYSAISLAGIVALVIGYGQTRMEPVFIWAPPVSMVLVTALLSLIAFVLVAAAYVPGNRIKAAVGQPITAGVKVWAFSHLLVNGRLGDIVLFGAFLVRAVLSYVTSRKADRAAKLVYENAQSIARDAITVAVGFGGWLISAMWAHVQLIGVSPFVA